MKRFIEYFYEVVRSDPEKTALVFEGDILSYAQLEKKSACVAAKLREAGIGKGANVPIVAERGISGVCAMIGVLRVGAAFCYISTDYPQERVEFIKKDVGAVVTIDDEWMQDLSKWEGQWKDCDGESALPAAEEPAIIVYTSGSTGNPKGVINNHHAVDIAVNGNRFSRVREDVFMSTAAFSFIAVVLDVLTPISMGATLHILPDYVRKDGDALVEYIHQNGITTGFIPPQMARQVLPLVEDQMISLIVGSDRVYGIYSEKMEIFNVYGASETCGPLIGFKVDRAYPDMTPIGSPYNGNAVYILDDELNPLPEGEVGEICVSGQVADGYLNLPELTAERFVANPFAKGEEDKVLFRTNDLGRINADGQVVYVQRKDWMLKVRGYRVEPGEIEQTMMKYAPINQAVVTGFQNAAGETSLYAVYTANQKVNTEEVTKAIRNFLPPYMMPAFMEQVDDLPLNQNGKVNRNAIKAPDFARFKAAYEAPTNEKERLICEAFEKVLSVEKVGVLDDFNYLGGDSILAARLQMELADFKISVSDILELGTPRKLAERREPSQIQKADERETWPLTFSERQMAIEQGMKPDSVSYNVNLAFRITGALDTERLQKALDALTERHRILRSYYPLEQGEYVHRIEDKIRINIEHVSCKETEAEEYIRQWNQPFDLEKAPLMRCFLMEHEDSYTLHFCMHHIIIDGTSADPFMQDLFALYQGENLQPLTMDYLDYAVWQEKKEESPSDEALFREMFAGGVPENEMPVVPVRPAELPVADTDLQCCVKTEELRNAAHRLGVTQYGLLMSVLGMTLAKYCGSEDVVIGTAMSGRTMKEQADTIGMFVNTLPVRVKPKAEMRISDYVVETAQTIRQVKAHQTYPFEKLVPMLAPDRNASRSPVFDVIFNYLQEMVLPETEGISIKRLPIKGQALNMDLIMEAMHEGDQVRIVLSYSRKLYLDQVAENFMEQFQSILAHIMANDCELISEAEELPARQREQILVDFAGKRTDVFPELTLVDLFRQQVKRTPDHRAVVFKEASLTYHELDQITDRLAVYLASKGIGRGKVVGIMVHRGLMMPIGAFGVLKTGAAYLPLDASYPSDRLEFMICDAGVELVIGDLDLQEKIPGFEGEYIDSRIAETFYHDRISGEVTSAEPIAAEGGSVEEASAESRLEGPRPEDLFILLYTSGTTGKPKGVMLLHQNIQSYALFYGRLNGICETDNIPAYASFGFDAHMMDMYPTLINGACLHIIPEEMRLDLTGLRDYFEKNQITVAFMTTQLGRQFADTMTCDTLRVLGVGGETLVPIEPPKFAMYNLYGPTECCVASNHFKVDRLYDRVPIGRATDNTSVYVLDAHGQLAPVGVAGELCIAGRQVAKGYLNREDLTAEKFVANPFSQDLDYARMYKTGDVVRFLPSGDIDFVGRRDFQVKIRGFRVELTEIEERIRKYPGIRDAAVIAQDDAAGGKRIVAYLVSDEQIEIPSVNAFIGEELPAYMIPSASMQIDKIPLNQNGKVDRRSLPKISIQAEEMVAPRTVMEQQVAEVAAEILGVEQVGVTTDLMYAGLNSLSAIKAAAIITERTGKKLATADILRERTVEKIAALLENGEDYQEQTFDKKEAYPLTANQLGLYFACMKEPGSLVYNIPMELAFEKADPEQLKESVIRVINAHSYVKTRFELRSNEPVQLRRDEDAVEIPIRKCTQEEYETRKESFVRPFELFGGVLYRIEICCTPDKIYMLCDFHHMIFDGGSMDIFLRDLTDAYAGKQILPERFSSFDLALLEAEHAKGEELEKAKAFYHERLYDGEGATIVPTDGTGEGQPVTTYAYVAKNKVEAAIKGLGVTPSNLFLASVLFVTGRFASARNVRIATITNGREGVQVQNNLGMLVKTLPLAMNLVSEDTAGDYLGKVQQEMSETLNHLAYTYMQASSDYNYHAQLLYAYQGGVVQEYQIEGEPILMKGLGLDRAKFPISLNIQEEGGNYVIEAEYDNVLFKEVTMSNFASCIAWTAENLAAFTEKKIGDIAILTREQQQMIRGFQKELVPVRVPSLPAMFEERVRETPDAMALIACDQEYTYRQLNARANALAHSLLMRGVKRGDRIAFMLPRDSRILVAMLGIMKAGGCYIPVDPDYPDERIAHILEDSGAAFILTDEARQVENGVVMDALLENDQTENLNLNIKGDDLCYIIYTSGSTGKPKGVVLTHRGIVNYVTDTEQNRHVRALVENKCIMASVTTVSFDMFLKEAFTTLMNGLTLVLADDEEAKNPDMLAVLMKRTGATAFNATPSRMLQYMQLPKMKEALAQCRVIMAGGEGYPPVLYDKLREVTDAKLINTYGPTEITVSSNGKLLDGRGITIGAPLHNVLELVMDVEENPVPVGVTGELWIGGMGVAQGYFGNPKMTEERFVEKYGVRWYKSGDLAKWTEDGEIVILGRNDGQIKLRGLRIELGEIESRINSLPEVTGSVVLVRKINGQEHLCAYYTASRCLPPQEMREELLKTLTKYMVPTAYLQMEAFPLTPNGKTDRKALPEAQLMQRDQYVQPANEAEAAYCAIFEEVLSLEKVGATDNFFDMGGTSLLVTQVTINAMEKGFGLSYSDVFANPTPRELAMLGGQKKDTEILDEIAKYDYTEIHRMLGENNLDSLRSGEYRELGNVCITGATGFLGIHVLKEYLDTQKGTAYCVVRSGKLSAQKRLKNALVYYFSESYDELFGNRIVVVEGDITDSAMYEKLEGYPVDTYINCAACVKHFSAGTEIEDINVGGVKNGVAFAKKKGCRFVQVSTASIAGMSIDGTPDESIKLSEQMLYFGQELSNKYARSKFLAERIILAEALQGLDAKIIRVGNLMAREFDGEFQMNFRTNNFLGRLKAYHTIGKISYEAMSMNCEFAPIDSTARAVLLLGQTPEKCRVFQPFNDHSIFMGDVIQILSECGVEIQPCESEVYDQACKEAFRDKNKARHLNSLIAYQEYGKRVVAIKADNRYTAQVLLRQGFMWPITTPQYLKNFFASMIGLGFFDEV